MKHAHIGIRVRDLERSKKFYGEILGGKLISEKKMEGVSLAFYQFGSLQIELINKENFNFVSNGIIEHIAFSVENIEAEIERLKQADVKFLMERAIDFGVSRIIFFEGPDGEHLEFMEEVEI